MGGDLPIPMPSLSDLRGLLSQIGGDGIQLPSIPSELPSTNDMQAKFEEIINKIQKSKDQLVAKAKEWYDDAVAALTRLGQLAGMAVQSIVDVAKAAYDKVTKFLNDIADAIGDWHFGPEALQLSAAWLKLINATSNAAAVLHPQQLHLYSDWPAGRAMFAYLGTIDAQRLALQRMADKTGSTVEKMLEAAAGFAYFFYLALAGIIAQLVLMVGIEIAKVVATGAVNTPEGAKAAIELIANVAKDVATAGIEAGAAYGGTVWQMRAWVTPLMRVEAVDNSALPNGSWPNPFVDDLKKNTDLTAP